MTSTPSQAIPVVASEAVSDTASVSIIGSATVNTPNTSSANLSGRPNVPLAGVTGVNEGRTQRAPLRALEADYTGGVTLEVELSILEPLMYQEGFAQYSGNDYSVPSGKRLVIESVSGSMDLPTGQRTFRVSFRSQRFGMSGPRHWLRPVLVATDVTGSDFYAIDERQVRALADQGDGILLAVTRTGFVGQTNVHLTLTGYLLDCSGGTNGAP